MKWPPWRRAETRASGTYTDVLFAAQLASATGEATAFPTATAALESCAGFVSRAFASAEVAAPAMFTDALSPECLGLIGRQLIRVGDFVALIRVIDGELHILPASSYDARGGVAHWNYRIVVNGPHAIETYHDVPAESVLHFRYAVDPARRWAGVGPIQIALLAGKLSAETVSALSDISSGPRGSFLSVPVDGADPTVASMKSDIPAARGRMLLGQGGDWDSGQTGGRAMWEAKPFHPDPPAALVTLLERAHDEVVGACGLTGLFSPRTDGTGRREAYRQALHSVVAPLGKIVARELSMKLEADITLDWQELRAGDIAGRARAFQSMVGAGMDVAKAATLAGLMTAE